MLQELIAWIQNQHKKAHFQFKMTSSVLEILEKWLGGVWGEVQRQVTAGHPLSGSILLANLFFIKKLNLALPGKGEQGHFLVLPQREGRPGVLDLSSVEPRQAVS